MKRIAYNIYKIIWKLFSNSRMKNWIRIKGFYLFHDLPKNILVSKGDVVLHAGCWQIETVREWSQSVGPEGKVIIIEANDYSYKLLTQELELRKRKLNNVTLIHNAVWNKKDKLTLEKADRSGSHKIKEAQTYYETNIGEYINESIVEANTIGNILNEQKVQHIDHFHITINGAEVEALEGIDKRFLKQGTRVFVYCETLITGTKETVTNRVVDRLENYGFKVVFHIHMPKQPNPVYGII
jgi:FkbM family methyltransferase